MTNHSASVFLIDDNVRAIGVLFEKAVDFDNSITHYADDIDEEDDPVYRKKPKRKVYASKQYVYKTMDPSIKEGDYVVVETNDGTNAALKVARVVNIDADIQFHSSVEYKWIVDKIDMSKYRELIAQELVMIDKLKVIERKSQRAKLKSEVLAFAGDEVDKVKFLTSDADTSLRDASPNGSSAGAQLSEPEV